jgi:signal transduction histidine kinase
MLITMRGKPDTSGIREMIDDARRQGDRLAKLINNLLDVSRLTAGKLTLFRETVDLAGAVRTVAERFGPELDQRKVRLDLQIPGSVQGYWDRLRIEQVVTNLIANAIQYGNGRPIRLTVQEQGTNALLVVQDEGIGISEDAMHRLFHPFERFNSSRHFGGLGLGLYIVRQIVQAHGGRIRVQSRVNEGSTFTVELPILRPAELCATHG